MKNLLIITFFTLAAWALQAQTLEYSQAKIIDNTLETVPAGKVWKVSSVSGTPEQLCVNFYQNFGGPTSGRPYTLANVAFMEVNGTRLYTYARHSLTVWYGGSDCASNAYNYSNSQQGLVLQGNANLLPMWLPAGTTIKSSSANTLITVVEFTVVP